MTSKMMNFVGDKDFILIIQPQNNGKASLSLKTKGRRKLLLIRIYEMTKITHYQICVPECSG